MNYSSTLLATALLCATLHAQGQTPAQSPAAATSPLAVGDLPLVFREGVDPAKLDALVADMRKRSSEMRAQGLKEQLAKDPAKIKMPWLGDWINVALYQGDRAKEANALLRNLLKETPATGDDEKDAPSEETPASNPKAGKKTKAKAPSANGNAMLQLNDGEFVIRMLAMFGRDGKYPGRLEADVEASLKAKAFEFASGFLDPKSGWVVFPLSWAHMLGTENQDIRHKPYIYLAFSALRKDPAYAGKSVGGKTVEEWFRLMRDCMKDYLKDRVLTGLWIEPGGHYAHINFDVMIDLYELSPDPEIRQRAKMFLDLVLIEDEQLSVNGLRGGAKSRTWPMFNNTGKFKDLVFGDKPGFLLSDYQAPTVAIVLRNAKGAVKPYHIYNRVPGEYQPPAADYLRNSHLISYAYRTPGYLMGTALRDPNLNYHPSSDQMRCSSVIFQSNEGVYPVPKVIFHKSGSGRPGKECWSVQHDGAMVVQKLLKSRFVDRMEVKFSPDLTNITERAGWIFAKAGSGYAAVRFVDPEQASGAGKYTWYEPSLKHHEQGEPGKAVSPARDFLPIIIQAGDPAQYGSFEKFQKAVLDSKITINAKASEMEYQSPGGPVITWNYKHDADPLVLPRVDGKTPDLQPALLFDSPFLKAAWEDPKIYAGAGLFRAVYDMEKCTVTESKK